MNTMTVTSRSERLARLGILQEPLGYVDGGDVYEYVKCSPVGGVDPLGGAAQRTAIGDSEIYTGKVADLAARFADDGKTTALQQLTDLATRAVQRASRSPRIPDADKQNWLKDDLAGSYMAKWTTDTRAVHAYRYFQIVPICSELVLGKGKPYTQLQGKLTVNVMEQGKRIRTNPKWEGRGNPTAKPGDLTIPEAGVGAGRAGGRNYAYGVDTELYLKYKAPKDNYDAALITLDMPTAANFPSERDRLVVAGRTGDDPGWRFDEQATFLRTVKLSSTLGGTFTIVMKVDIGIKINGDANGSVSIVAPTTQPATRPA
jgi:hypothetical protein